MEKLLDIADKEHIEIVYLDMTRCPRTLLGLYFQMADGQPCIVIQSGLERNVPMFRSVFAEELGHHFTVPTSSILRAYTSYSLKIAMNRDEERALRWACDLLLPLSDFEKSLREVSVLYDDQRAVVNELAQLYRVTPWLVYRRLQFRDRI